MMHLPSATCPISRQLIRTPYFRLKDFETKPNNNILERLNRTFRETTKVLRSFDNGLGEVEFVEGMPTYTTISGHIRESAGKFPHNWQISHLISQGTGGKQ